MFVIVITVGLMCVSFSTCFYCPYGDVYWDIDLRILVSEFPETWKNITRLLFSRVPTACWNVAWLEPETLLTFCSNTSTRKKRDLARYPENLTITRVSSVMIHPLGILEFFPCQAWSLDWWFQSPSLVVHLCITHFHPFPSHSWWLNPTREITNGWSRYYACQNLVKPWKIYIYIHVYTI